MGVSLDSMDLNETPNGTLARTAGAGVDSDSVALSEGPPCGSALVCGDSLVSQLRQQKQTLKYSRRRRRNKCTAERNHRPGESIAMFQRHMIWPIP